VVIQVITRVKKRKKKKKKKKKALSVRCKNQNKAKHQSILDEWMCVPG